MQFIENSKQLFKWMNSAHENWPFFILRMKFDGYVFLHVISAMSQFSIREVLPFPVVILSECVRISYNNHQGLGSG